LNTSLDLLCDETAELAYALTARPSRAVASALVRAIIDNVRLAGGAPAPASPRPPSDTNGSDPADADRQLWIELAETDLGKAHHRLAHADTSA
jgi:hypothetical protein